MLEPNYVSRCFTGRFGTGVSSFFVFLKSLLFLNITTFILEFGLVTLPSVIIENNITSGANTNSCYYDELHTQNKTSFMTLTQQAADFISGKGWINRTVMFYAGYPASMLISDAGVTYNLPLAYLLVGCSYFVCSLFMVVRSLGTSLRESYVESGGTSTSCSNSIFAAWDFCITHENTAKAKIQTIGQNFRAQFAEEERRIKVESRTTPAKCGLYTLRTLSTLLVLALLGGAIYAIVFAVAISTDPVKQCMTENVFVIQVYKRKASEAFEGGEKLLLFGPSLVITVLNLVFPFIFDFLSRFEDWSPGFEVNITLFRTVLLRLASLGVLMIKIYSKVDEACEDNPQTCCQQNWENEIASQMYMLIWLDFFSHIFSSLMVTSIRKLLYKYTECFKKVGLPVFDIPKQVLRLVYGECLIWIGTFFSPVMPAMGVVKLFIIFYVELLAVLLNYRPSQKAYRATRSNHLFTVLLLISFFLCLGTVGWGIAG
ncbi:transmembrane channel-like protein 7 [Orbicella faveolata]|uniref:transmembrane channel-like protein 7 n=1 Tax=Orbicella faveolata TaxID=48498 RepID=UPI0009E640C7|nr:transmembrane channel-like protein 7 [Orbicella faveolata]